mmetsp:Transcript_14465/g.24701  ORF Transcript_14465/g.24701 Transcript_14465/m.24701 type:complete len:83 (+) Transcript_14465:644-892(+)
MDFSLPLINCLITVLEELDDDRMGEFVPFLLSRSIEYLEMQNFDQICKNKLLFLIQVLYKNIEWAIGVDPQLVGRAVKEEET